MATVPFEQVTQPYKTGDVSITDGRDDTTIGERLWLSTRTGWDTIVNTKSVITSAGGTNQTDRDALEARVMANFGAEQVVEGGEDTSLGALSKIGDTTLSAANNATTTKDIESFVAGNYTPFVYWVDDASEDDFGTSTMTGSTLQYASGASDGADTVLVNVRDQKGFEVQVTVTVTVTVA